jgi:hypothetical protein
MDKNYESLPLPLTNCAYSVSLHIFSITYPVFSVWVSVWVSVLGSCFGAGAFPAL